MSFKEDPGFYKIYTHGAPCKMRQVLINLLNNASDALKDSELKNIAITCTETGSFIEVKVEDSGHGIPANIREKIFDPFFSTKEVNEGSGIGLSLAHRYVAEMGGDLTVESISGSGSSFSIRLSIAKKGSLNESSRPTGSGETSPLKILLVEDEESLSWLLKKMLEDMGHHVETADNGKRALELHRVAPQNYDLIISDIIMPVMDGLTLLKSLRDQSEIPQPKFIIYTGGSVENLEAPSSEIAGIFDAYFSKPFNEESVKASIEKCFKKAS